MQCRKLFPFFSRMDCKMFLFRKAWCFSASYHVCRRYVWEERRELLERNENSKVKAFPFYGRNEGDSHFKMTSCCGRETHGVYFTHETWRETTRNKKGFHNKSHPSVVLLKQERLQRKLRRLKEIHPQTSSPTSNWWKRDANGCEKEFEVG